MANTFKIVITATDRATATVRKVKDAISQFTRPVRQVAQSARVLTKELGIDKIAKGIGAIAKGAAGAALKIGGVVAGIAGVAGAASLAAIAAMARQWAFAGSEILRTASVIGIATDRLQTMRGAAVVFGLSADAMTNGLKSLGQTMEDALYGRNQDALVMMTRLGITMHRAKDGSIDTARALLDVAGAMVKIKNVQAQGLVARTFGLEELLPLLQKGPGAIADYERQVRATKSLLDPDSLKRLQDFQQKTSLLSLAISGLGQSIGARLLPMLTPAISGLTQFIERVSTAIQKHQDVLLLNQVAAGKGIGFQIGQRVGIHFFDGSSGGKREHLKYNWLNPFGGGAPAGGAVTPALLELIRWLEGSGDRAVSRPAFPGSRGGAIGRFQVTPDTARRYGYDPSRLKDPVYNTKVASTIIADLARKYRGDLDDILIGYNSTPERVDRFNRSGRDLRALLPETRQYLTRAHNDPALRGLIAQIIGSRGSTGAGGGPQEMNVNLVVRGLPPGSSAHAHTTHPGKTSVRVEHSLVLADQP